MSEVEPARAGPRAWTTVEDIRAKVRRRWSDGGLPTAYVRGEDCPLIEIPLRGPRAGEVGAELARVRSWKAELEKGSAGGRAFTLDTRAIGGRLVGRNELPARARVDTYAAAWRLLGVAAEVQALDDVVASTRVRAPELVDWVARHPLSVIPLAAQWDRLLAAARWLASSGGQGRYLRQIDVPGVDTKFVERHCGVLAGLLDELLPPERVDARHTRGAGFAPRYGFAEPVALIHVRCGEGFAGLPRGVSEVAWRAGELARLRVGVRHVVIIENLVTYLSVPVPADGVVIWGSGYAVARLGRYPWIGSASRVSYSGDLDTHGFAILSMLRGQLSRTGPVRVESVLMDRTTLLAHRDRWGREGTPTRARLDHLTGEEQSLYADLVEDVYAPAVRLEQERIDWGYAIAAMDWADR